MSLLRRTVAVLGVLLAVATAFAAGYAVAPGHAGEKQPDYRLAVAGLDSGLSCDALRQWYVDHSIHRVTAWGWQGPLIFQGALAEDTVRAAAPTPSLDTQTGSATGTNVQEAAVDEPDVVKTIGRLLVRVDAGSLETYDVSGTEPRRLGAVALGRVGNPQLLLSGDRAVVIGDQAGSPEAEASPFIPSPRTRVLTYDLSDPSAPALLDSRLYGGSLVTARQTGSVIRLVLDAGLPSLHFVRPSSKVTEKQALEHNRQVVRESTVADWLPRVTTYPDGRASTASLADCGDVAVPEKFAGLGTLTIVGFDPADPADTDTSALATGSDTAYMSPSQLYVAASPWSTYSRGFGPPVMPMDTSAPTRIYGFELSGTSAPYVGMGSVRGTVAGSWSMDEQDGVLRVAVSSFDLTRRPTTGIVMLRPESGRLVDIGRLGGLGVGQELQAVRWFDDLALLVTFEQTDPFYVVDVADPTAPRVLGALHLPGWSSYLHPVGPHLVLGLGQSSPGGFMVPFPEPRPLPAPPRSLPVSPDRPTAAPAPNHPTPAPLPKLPIQRAKATLFDITDLAHPRDVDTVAYPAGSEAMGGADPHQVTWLPDRHTLLTVISEGAVWTGMTPQTTHPSPRAWVSVLTVRDGSLDDRLVPVSGFSDVGDIRTVPLDDGRVALVAGNVVRFLHL